MGILPKFFGDSKNQDKLVLVFDIGSSSVGGALFYMRENGIPEIVLSVREPIVFDKELNVEKFLDITIRALDGVAGKVASASVGAPKKIFTVLSSPWHSSQNRTIKLEKNTPFIFNTKLADSLIEKEVKLFEEDHLRQYLEAGVGIRAIELKNIKTKLNGYEVADPCNQTAKDLEMSIFISMAGEDILSQIEMIVAKHFHTKEVIFSSFLMTLFTVVRDMFVHQDDFLLVDIGAEVTDISMVKKNILRESVSYPLGRHFMIRGIAKALNTSLDEAKSTFSLYKDGHAEEGLKQKLNPIILQLKNEWLHKFQSSLANLSNDISIPATIFISIDKDYAEFFGDIIKTEQFNQYTLTESKFQIIFINTEKLHGVALFKDDINRDACLIIDAVYINRFLK